MSRTPKRRDWSAQAGTGWLWRASVLAGLSTLLGLAAVSAAMVVINIPLPHEAEASPQYAGPWDFAPESLAQLNGIAIQACAAERGATSAGAESSVWVVQQTTLQRRYTALAGDYDRRVRDVVADGERRPWEVPAGAPPLATAKARVCLKPGEAPLLAAVRPEDFVHASSVLSEAELDVAGIAAGWPQGPGWWDEMKRIVYCESGRNMFAHNLSDPNGGSYGLAQMNGRQHFDKSGENFELRFDPIINLRTALWLRTVRGHFGGGGGWSCADKLGIR